VATPSHYEVLGVSASATQAEVRAAYRAAARDHHPDAGGDAAHMRALNVAWAVLGDPVRRAAYDRALAGAGTFKKFRETLARYPAVRDEWSATRERHIREAMLQWLEAQGIEPQTPLPPPRGRPLNP